MKRIGIALRVEIHDDVNILQFHDSIRTKLNKYKDINLIGIIPKSSEFYLDNSKSISDTEMLLDTLKLCDGIILPGGYDIFDYDIFISQYCYDNNIPIMGICLGMQTMGLTLGGEMGHVENKNHQVKSEYAHNVILKDGTIFKVNSKHKDRIVNLENKYILGKSDDGIIEVIGDESKKHFIGYQWHPEDLNDPETDKLFNKFIDSL